MASQDTEITLGTGKMLALFFGLVMLCAVFFGLGFSLGRSSARPTLAAEAGVTTAPPGVRTSADKSAAANSQNDTLTFYKAVEQKDATPALNEASTKNSPPAEAAAATAPPSQPAAAEPITTLPSASNYFVQVAAVSKQDDAQALVDALKKKQYSAFAANNAPGDKLYHVQIGPFGDIKDAELTRSKLIGDGYNPILKR